MKRSPLCPCGDVSCHQLSLVHKQIERSYSALQKISRAAVQDELLADDLLQQFCTNIVARPHNFTPDSSFIALGRVSIKRLYLNSLRNKRILTPANSHDSVKVGRVIERGGLTPQVTSEDSYKDVEFKDLIKAMCDTLPNEAEQTTFMMLYLGHSGREISEKLNMNINTVHGMIRRIRLRLLDQFSELCVS